LAHQKQLRMNKKVLITGSAGLLGSHLSKYLLAKGYSVIGIDDLSGGYEDFQPKHDSFVFYKRCLGKDEIFDIFEAHDIDCVFHFAAYAAEGLSPFIRRYNYQSNVMASIDLINECINRDIKLVFTSSMAVYGDQQAPFTEDMVPMPPDPYGIAKYAVELDILQANQQFDLQYNIIRPHNVLGPYQNIWDKYRNAIGIFIRRTLDGLPMLVYGDGKQTRAFSDIKYYMEPFEKLISSHNNETYNIGSNKHYTLTEAANLVGEVSQEHDIKYQIQYAEARHEVKHAYCDHAKAERELQFEDKTILKDLIREMFIWAINQKPREIIKMPYEVNKNMYSFWQ